MKLKALTGLIIAGTLVVATGTIQAAMCVNPQPGRHMVSKCCQIKTAENWQEYASGIYLPPMMNR